MGYTGYWGYSGTCDGTTYGGHGEQPQAMEAPREGICRQHGLNHACATKPCNASAHAHESQPLVVPNEAPGTRLACTSSQSKAEESHVPHSNAVKIPDAVHVPLRHRLYDLAFLIT